MIKLLENPAFFLLPILLIGSFIDLRQHRIPNWLNLITIILGLTFQFIFFQGSGLLNGLGGFAVGFISFIPLYALRAMGAGDVKLMAAIGCFLTPMQTLEAVLATIIVGGFLGVIVLIARGGLGRYIKRYVLMAQTFFYMRKVLPIAPAIDEPARTRFPYAVAIAAGTFYTLWTHGYLLDAMQQSQKLLSLLL
ncbi:MAG: A24 family peptidase [Methylococcaceae bacterium]